MSSPDATALWNRVLEALGGRIAPRTIDTLLRPLEALEATTDALGGVFLLQAPNEFSRDWVSRHFGPVIEEQLGALTGATWSLHWTVLPAPAPTSTTNGNGNASASATGAPSVKPPAKKAPAPARRAAAPRTAAVAVKGPGGASVQGHGPGQGSGHGQARGNAGGPLVPRAPVPSVPAISRGLHPRYTFENFVTGPSNQLAHSAAVSMAVTAGLRFNPLFLCGGTGLGKTHLVNAIGHRILEQKHDAVVIYVSAEHFMNEFVASLRSSTMADFRARYRETCDALLMDDVQFFAGKDLTQEEFFHTFNALYLRGRPIVLTSDVAPADLKGLPERLVSRFASGLVAEVYPPELETRMAIVRRKADQEGIAIDDEASLALASAVTTNVRDLEGTLMKLAIKASLAGRPAVDADAVREALRIPVRQSVTTVEDIQRAVCDHFRIKLAQLVGKERHQEVALPRQVAMYLCRERLGTSYPQIGSRFGGKDHTTVIAAVNKIKKLLTERHEVQRDIDAVLTRLGQPPGP